MDNELKKAVIRYAIPDWWHTAAGIIFIAAGILLLIPIMLVPTTRRILEVSFELDITLFILGAALLVRKYIYRQKILKTLDKIENIGGEFALRNDFENGEKFYSGYIILGNRFVIGKARGAIVAYEDMERVYVKIHKRRFMEVYRQIKVVLENGKTVTVCTVPKVMNKDGDTHKVLKIMESHNSRL